MIQYKKLMMTLALLLTAATGAWAGSRTVVLVGLSAPTDNSTTYNASTWEWIQIVEKTNANYVDFEIKDNSKFASGDGSFKPTHTQLFNAFNEKNGTITQICGNDGNVSSVQLLSADGTVLNTLEFNKELSWGDDTRIKILNESFFDGIEADHDYIIRVNLSGYLISANGANKWQFEQPGSNVVLTPIYARAAAFATTGEEPEVKTLLPAAAEGVVAGTTAPLIAEGTGVVAFAGTSTTVTQGQLMYAIGTSATTAPAFDGDAWSTTVPTAENVNEDGAEVPVWYYIKGADAPDGEDASLDNTFDNTDPVCLIVPIRSNKFDLTLKAANVNTIDATDASKGTVTVKVGDAEAVDKTEDITNGKLEAIKMGSEVKLNTKPGYKFRKVEVKKRPTSLTITDGGEFSTTLKIEGCTTWDQVITKNPDMIRKDNDGFIWPNFGHNTYTLEKGQISVNASDEIYPDATDYRWLMAD